MSRIQILVASNKDVYVPDNGLLRLVQAGSASAEQRIENMLHDDEGESISEKNKTFCELTVQYWAWKNLEADYYGFFHYRRYMDFSREYSREGRKMPVGYRRHRMLPRSAEKCCYKREPADHRSANREAGSRQDLSYREAGSRQNLLYREVGGRHDLSYRVVGRRHVPPYKEVDSIHADLTSYGLEEKHMRRVIEAYDVITVLGEWMNVTVYEQYCQFHDRADMDRAIRILKEKYPKYAESCSLYMKSRYIYFCNMYIMRRKYFYAYMEWLFPILEAFEAETDFSECSERQLRAPAFLAERLFGVWYTQLKRKSTARCCELGYLIFHDTAPRRMLRPYFGADSVCLASASNDAFAPYLGVMLQSAAEHVDPAENYDIIILHAGIRLEYQKTLEQITDGRPNMKIRFLDVSDAMAGIDLPVHHHFSIETYYRYLLLDLLPEYEKVLWMDADLVILQDVGNLYHTPLCGHSVGAVLDLDVIGAYKSDPQVKKYIDQKLKIRQPHRYFQAGVMLLNLTKIRKKYSAWDLIRMSVKYPWRMLDQDVLNKALEGDVLELEQKWNVLMNWQHCGSCRIDLLKNAPYELFGRYLAAREEPAVIHYAGGFKPWKVPDCDYAQLFWEYARRSPFYEVILYSRVPEAGFQLYQGAAARRSFRLKPTNIVITVNMSRVNRLLPPGSMRRRIVRTVCGKFL